MIRISTFISLIVLLFVHVPTIYAWDFQIGYQRLLPKLGTNDQEYEGRSGGKMELQPKVKETILGQSMTLGVMIENYLIQYEQSEFTFDSTIPAENQAVSDKTDIECKIVENRLGVSYHLEKELAGIFLGAGLSSQEERLTSAANEWVYNSITLHTKFGIDLVFGIARIRVEQIHYKIGNHSTRINSGGILFAF